MRCHAMRSDLAQVLNGKFIVIYLFFQVTKCSAWLNFELPNQNLQQF